MPAFNEIAPDEIEKQQGANQGKIGEFCFATMGSGVRSSPGPPSNTLIPRNLNEFWSNELAHGAQPWGLDSTADSKLLRTNQMALTHARPNPCLEFLCPFLALRAQRNHAHD
jgi:hypothetical protein